jgi:hypothetical protein
MPDVKLDNGITVKTFEAPPAGFDPLTAKPDMLEKLGFPSHHDNPHHMERYARVMAQLKGKFHYIQPTFRVNSHKFHGPRKKGTKEGTETSGNWSGGVVYAASGQSFKWIEGDWVVPNVDAPTQNQWYYSASWIGIDGDGSGDVCQAGVECEVYQSGTSITRNIYPWWEWYPESEVQITNIAVSPGDFLTMLICTPSGVGSTTATFYLTNRTTGASTSLAFTAPSGTKLVGNSAEWIVEAPTVGGQQSAIADYGQVIFTTCEAETVSGTLFNGGTGNNINLGNVSAGTLVASTVVECEYVGTLA